MGLPESTVKTTDPVGGALESRGVTVAVKVVGWPGKLDNNGPSTGMLGFGVLGSGFSSGVIYGTPKQHGFQLDIGLFDPVQLQGSGSWTHTYYTD